MTTWEIIRLVIEVLVVVVISTYYIIKIIKNKWFSKISDCIKTAIVEAELTWPEGHGEEKKNYVIEKTKKYCEELGIPFGILYNLIIKLINTIVANYNLIKKG